MCAAESGGTSTCTIMQVAAKTSPTGATAAKRTWTGSHAPQAGRLPIERQMLETLGALSFTLEENWIEEALEIAEAQLLPAHHCGGLERPKAPPNLRKNR